MDSQLGIDFVQPSGAASAPGPAVASGQTETSFRDVLSAMNPLQYVPVVGSIYRALTGDGPPEPVRAIGSVIFSGLTGGPIGAAIDVAEIALEKLTGIEPDQIVHSLMASMGMVGEDSSQPSMEVQRAATAAYAQTSQLQSAVVGRG